ncbi:MAG TPA: pyridoxamine 5'-phosphate oxidase [Bryobacteraceae bacterium]|jgi:pyridoxamine 5'-phosphate oxidase|nr:pyridoxamine 5'-phosphate oxidase [Bryobacteraceae bacterium]
MADHAASSLKLSLADLRENYTQGGLDEAAVDTNPIAQFEKWFAEALRAGLKEPNAMTLATATPDGRPSARIVLLKEVDEAGFVFYTNYESRKARELRENPRAALTLYWAELERQVRVEGIVKRVSRGQSEHYFQSRPKGSRLGAWASHQSAVIPNRTSLEARLKDLEARYSEIEDVPLPEFWGGYRVEPEVIEFWQGRPNRLHDRLQYWRDQDQLWQRERLAP